MFSQRITGKEKQVLIKHILAPIQNQLRDVSSSTVIFFQNDILASQWTPSKLIRRFNLLQQLLVNFSLRLRYHVKMINYQFRISDK